MCFRSEIRVTAAAFGLKIPVRLHWNSQHLRTRTADGELFRSTAIDLVSIALLPKGPIRGSRPQNPVLFTNKQKL